MPTGVQRGNTSSDKGKRWGERLVLGVLLIMRFCNLAREKLSPDNRFCNDSYGSSGSLPANRIAGNRARTQSLTTKRGGQSSRRPSLWACNSASVQSWKKWLRSLNPKSRTIRSNVSRCSRRTLVVRLPCISWVNSGSFILTIQRRCFNDSIPQSQVQSLARTGPETGCRRRCQVFSGKEAAPSTAGPC